MDTFFLVFAASRLPILDSDIRFLWARKTGAHFVCQK